MAKNAKYYAKIGSNWEQQYFETTAGQTSFDSSSVTGLIGSDTTVQAALVSLNDAVGADSGIASLDANGKLTSTQIPSSIVGGMTFVDVFDLSADNKTVDDIVSLGVNAVGEYAIVSSAGAWLQGSTYTATVQSPGDEGDSTFSGSPAGIEIEAGDWIVLTDIDENDATQLTFAIINNTYQNANAGAYGIVRLSNQSAYGSLSGNDVVTEGVLKTVLDGNIGTGSTNFAAGNHTHTQYARHSGATFTGNVIIGDGDTSHPDLILNYVDSDATSVAGSDSEDITFRYVELSTGTQSSKSLKVSKAGYLQFSGDTVAHENNWNSTAVGIPEIFVNTSAPTSSDGKAGDVWIEYTA
jgi:hypothetical protein